MPPTEPETQIIVDDMALQAPRMAQSTSYDIRGDIERVWASSGASIETLEILLAIGMSESLLDPKEDGPTNDRGAWQWTEDSWLEECSNDFDEAYNLEISTLCTIKSIEKNQLWRWSASRNDRPASDYFGWFNRLSDETQLYVRHQDVLCSCVLYLRMQGMKFPRIATPADLQPNTSPAIGVAVLLLYSIGGSHMAIITDWTKDGFMIKEANYFRCRFSEREITWENFRRVGRGFFRP